MEVESTQQHEAARRISRTLAKQVLLFCSLVAAIFLLNTCCRLLYDSSGFSTTFANGKHIVEFVAGRESDPHAGSRVMPHPYMLYVNRPNFREGSIQEHDGNGYRIVPGAVDGRDKVKVLLLGGSTTYGWGTTNPSETWAAQLQSRLGPRYDVINGGLPYATSAEMLADWVFKNRFLHPNIVIIHEGGNDVAPLLFPGYRPDYSHFRAAGGYPAAGRFETVAVRRFGYVPRVLYAINWNRVRIYREQPTSFEAIPNDVALYRARTTSIEGFSRNLDMLVSLVQQIGATPVLFGFKQAREPLLTRNRPDLVGKEKAFEIGLDRNLEEMKRLARQRGVLFLDPSELQIPDSMFLDNCHLNADGERLKAVFVYNKLVENGIIR